MPAAQYKEDQKDLPFTSASVVYKFCNSLWKFSGKDGRAEFVAKASGIFRSSSKSQRCVYL